ncbi:phage distal tail protein domain-containing protein [Lactococcus lactis]|uniref:phage distal tail protein domain-containing protein n=1 Tax=Lactococcus lactis TaxID=1358 RepID=UPI00071D16FF|nr:phage distal tail protein domain-containing protein [Lactococcus lactis]KST92176.1 Phage tail assembly [Lactococcus lactis subsp. lactis]
MVRQYRIHTDLDGFENKIYDMTNGLIRLYQPSDLGIINSTNIWQSQGIGVMGNNNISHPDIDFKFETFGNSLEENYRIFNEFINSIIKQKYITLEYTNEIGTYFADIQLSKITKTEGYGFDGQFSETISFIPVNMWYVYEQLKFSKVQNGEIGGNTKIYGNKETTVYPNLNLLDGTRDFSGNWTNSNSWTTDGTYKGLTVKKITTQWSGIYKTFTVPKDGAYTFSAYIKSSGNTANVFRYGGVNSTSSQGIIQKFIGNNFDWTRDSVTLNLKANDTVWIRYEISGARTDSILWVAGYKWEQGSTATPWMPSASEVTPSDYRDYGSYKYDYTYFGEDNIERFSKWKIDDGIFSFTARMTPSKNLENVSDYGVRFLDEQFNEYTALIFGNTTKPDSIQFNTDVNDEYYQAQIGTSTINMFSALNYQRFRTRLIQKGTMELINVDVVEMNVKRKVDFV